MSTCPRCGGNFSCGSVDGAGDQPCWCCALPTLSADALRALGADQAAGCFCQECLKAVIATGAEPPATGIK